MIEKRVAPTEPLPLPVPRSTKVSPMTEAEIADALALTFAKLRTGGSVYMDGEHNPTPSERRIAADFVKYVVAPHLRTD
jgi:hypothetical protein